MFSPFEKTTIQFAKELLSKIIYMFISFNNQSLNSEFCSHGKLKTVHSHCHMKTLHCMMKTIHRKIKTIKWNINTAMQNEGSTLKYKVS